MKKLNRRISGLVAAMAVGIGASTSAFGSIVDLTTAGASGTILGATFQQVPDQSTGTGVIDSFVRIQQNGNEGAYNTSGSLGSGFDQHGGSQYNRDVLLSSVPIVNGSYQFLLDINQNNSKPEEALLSLNQLQVFLTGTPGQTGGSRDANGYLTGFTGTTVYDMNPGGGTANGVTLNFDLNPGSGAGDMFLYIPTSAFNVGGGAYVVLYSHFGHLPGDFESNDGFEEWATFTPSSEITVPEPTTVIAGALLLLPFGASTIRILRRKRTA